MNPIVQSLNTWRLAVQRRWAALNLGALSSQSTVWLIAVLVFTAVLALDLSQALKPANRWLYDHALFANKSLTFSNDDSAAEALEQEAPLLIAIDEYSLKTLGRWPWPRSYHAELLKRLSADNSAPKVVAFDVVFAEPHTRGVTGEDNDDDALFAKAIQDSAFPVVLAAQVSEADGRQQFIKPHEPLASSGARLAHIHIDADTDGAVRRYIPIDYDMGGLALPYMGKAMLFPYSASKANAIRIGGQGGQNGASGLSLRSSGKAEQSLPRAFYPMSEQWVKSVPFAKVLSGEVPASFWENKRILIASTAKGLGDQYVTPLYSPSTIVSGGELILGALHAELWQQAGKATIVEANAPLQWGSLALILLLCLFLFRRSVHFSSQAFWLIALLLGGAAVVLWVLAAWGVWINPAQHIVALLLTCLLWLAYRLNRVLAFLLERIRTQTQAGAVSANGLIQKTKSEISPPTKPAGDALEARLIQAQSVETIRQSEYALLSEVLELLPDAAFVLSSDLEGGLIQGLQNYAARQLAQQLPSVQAAISKPYLDLNALLAQFRADLTSAQLDALRQQRASPQPNAAFEWQALLALCEHPAFDQGVEADLSGTERYLINVRRMQAAQSELPSERYILTLVNLSVTQALSREREQTLNFLSHDLRSPQAAIIATLELETRDQPTLAPLFQKIQAQAQRTLDLAEGFVQWSRARQAHSYQLNLYNLNDLVIEATDELWANAKQQQVSLHSDLLAQDILVSIDRSLMWRAVVNVLRNALNVSADYAQIHIRTHTQGKWAVVSIEDQGPGIPAHLHTQVFEPFLQGGGLNRKGAGLGLAFVQSVLREHGGSVTVHSPVNTATPAHAVGTRFELRVPLAAA